MFSVLDADTIRGARDVAAEPYKPLCPADIATLPEAVRSGFYRLAGRGRMPTSLTFANRGLGIFWEVRDTQGAVIARLEPTTGLNVGRLIPSEAEALARRDFVRDVAIQELRLIESDPPVEVRNRSLPLYLVAFDAPRNPHIYVDALTGEIVARRNTPWRVFDFFWMLHTMDYCGRDNFNRPIVTIFSALAVATSASGLILWGWRFGVRARRRVQRQPGTCAFEYDKERS